MDRNGDLQSEYERLESAGLLTAKARAKQSREKDYHARNGATKPAIITKIDLTKFLPPLHYLICSLNHIESFAYRINTKLEKFLNKKRVMGRGGKRQEKETMKAINESKKKLIKEAKETIGLLLDSPNGGGNGGSTDGANNSRQFFSEKNREKVLDLFKVDARDRAKIKRILR